MEKRWSIPTANPARVALLQKELKINNALCGILVSRGIENYTQAKNYFRPSLDQLHQPLLMKDMGIAVQRVIAAIHQNENILIYGDYDVDGTTSVAVMVRFLKSLNASVDYYVPHRYREGYGISKEGIAYAIENRIGLIIAVDCGIKAIERIAEAKASAIDVIVCDHHMPDDDIPEAVAILNPKQVDCFYPFKELCGCGVAIKLIQGIAEQLQLPQDSWIHFLQFAAIAIAADIVPITGENRILAFYGLQQINADPLICLKALFHLSNHVGQVHINTLVFVVAPRINAAGRMDDARKAIKLFLEDDFDQSIALAQILHEDNTERREADSTITDEALQQLAETNLVHQRKTTVVYSEQWHKGVVGIVASRLIDTYYRPTVVLTKSGDKISGSARSVSGFNLYEAIHACRHLLDNYGGHFYAAGLTMPATNLEAFVETFEQVVAASITEDQLVPEVIIDAKIDFKDITKPFYNIVCQMEPFGPMNMRPVFASTQVFETGSSRIVKEQHLKLTLKHGNTIVQGIGFGLAGKIELLKPNQPLDIAYTIDINEWQGESNLQLRVIDIRKTNEHDWVGH